MEPETNGSDPQILCFGEFQLDKQLRSLHRGSEELKLSAKPFATLEFLIENRQRVVSKTELLDSVWRGRQEINTVEQAVRKIRKVLNDDAGEARYIETIQGQGYRFIADVLAALPTQTAGVIDPRFSRRSLLISAAAAPMAWLTGLAAFRFIRRPESVARVAINGTNLVALDTMGRALWTYQFEEALTEPPATDSAWRTQIVDLDGDGVPEILFVAGLASAMEGPRELCCFSSAGKLLWRYAPKVPIRFRRPDLNGPWCFQDVLVVPGKTSATIWVAVAHCIWWPSFVMRISASGMSELVYVNSGAIYQLQSIRNRTGSYILTAAVNNEYRQAAMAVLSTSAPPSTSPQTGWSEFQCIAGCPPATPYRYFLMPHSEVGIASGAPYNEARYIHLRPGGITVDVRETSLEMQRSLYDFSNDFKPERAAYCSGYRAIHERFEKEGRLHHRYEDCPERKTEATLRACDDLGNWRTEKIPLLRPYE